MKIHFDTDEVKKIVEAYVRQNYQGNQTLENKVLEVASKHFSDRLDVIVSIESKSSLDNPTSPM